MSSPSFIAPGATLGVMGGGQLGRMLVHAAQSMGYFTAVLDPPTHHRRRLTRIVITEAAPHLDAPFRVHSPPRDSTPELLSD